jgi:sodium/potassium-transporting ATPase subunit beta
MANAMQMGTAIKPPDRTAWEGFKFFMYDPDKGAYLGRTPKSWGLISAAYLVYYIFLALFWTACLFIFFQTLDDKVPRWDTDESIIGCSPAIGVRPEQAYERIDSSMIMYNQASEASKENMAGWKEWVDRTTEFLEPYKNQDGAEDCAASGPAGAGQVCKFDLNQLGACAEGNYGYDKGKPCIFLKLNKIYNLVHDYYNNTDAFPEKIPSNVKDRIAKLKLEGDDMNQVWVNCHGENSADRESMGDIKYFPEAGAFHGKYYPYTNQDGYLTPVIAVQFLNPQAGQLLHIECRAYADNINYDRRDKIGKAHFEVLVHNEITAK